MKKTLLTLALVTASVAGFAQGKISLANDTLHLVYFSTDTTKLAAGDQALAGKAMSSAVTLASGRALSVDLYAGSSAGTLSLVGTTSFGAAQPAAGKWVATSIDLPSPTFPASTLAYFQINIHEVGSTSATDAWSKTGVYGGVSTVFTAKPQPASYSPIYQTAGVVASTWATGSFDLGYISPGQKGAIELTSVNVPEPASFALAGLGAAALVIFRRRK
jgi:hypothetical protein